MADTDTSKINYSSGYTYNPENWQQSSETSTSTTNQASETQRQLNAELLSQILAGLTGQMTDEEISAFAENLLRPQLNADIEASQQTYETTRLAKEQEIANLASELQRAIDEQGRSYRQSMADVDSAALARGMGRSSYTLQTLANQGGALAEAVRQLTDESARQSAQLQAQITQAAQQNAQTQARLNADYAANLAAKVQELRQTQKQEYNQNYMTAVSEALGSKTTNDSTTTGSGTSSAIAGSASAPAPVGGSSGSSGSSGGGSSGSKTASTGKGDILTTVETRPIRGSMATSGARNP